MFDSLSERYVSWQAPASRSSGRTPASLFEHFSNSAGLSFCAACFYLCFHLLESHRAWIAWCCTSFSFQTQTGCLSMTNLCCQVLMGCCGFCPSSVDLLYCCSLCLLIPAAISPSALLLLTSLPLFSSSFQSLSNFSLAAIDCNSSANYIWNTRTPNSILRSHRQQSSYTSTSICETFLGSFAYEVSFSHPISFVWCWLILWTLWLFLRNQRINPFEPYHSNTAWRDDQQV